MNDISINAYVPLCEQYNDIAQSFFQQYKDLRDEQASLGKPIDYFEKPNEAEHQTFLSIGILRTAIGAVVFEAFAIESYVNFWGASLLGDSQFYEKYESGKKGQKYSTIEKIKLICKDDFQSPYPTGGTHFSNLKALFSKRDRLAHNKPKGHKIELIENALHSEFESADKEISFVFDNLETDMTMYSELKTNLTHCSGKPEPMNTLIEELKKACLKCETNILTAY